MDYLCFRCLSVEDQQLVHRVIRARRLLLMGESADPAPDEIEIAEGFDELGVPYIAINSDLIKLPPIVVWELVQQRANKRLLFLDRVSGTILSLQNCGGRRDGRATQSAQPKLLQLCEGRKRPSERIELRDGRHLAREWGEKRRLIEETGARGEGLIPWDLLVQDTLGWFVARLSDTGEGAPPEIICDRLLDGRTSINGHERRQLVLLIWNQCCSARRASPRRHGPARDFRPG